MDGANLGARTRSGTAKGAERAAAEAVLIERRRLRAARAERIADSTRAAAGAETQGPEPSPPRAAGGGATEAGGSGRAYQQPKPAPFEGVRSTGPGCDIFWCARSRRHKRLRARLSRAGVSADMCRRDEEWTRLLKEGPGENARLFVDYFLLRLPAKEAVRRFAHEGLRLSTPRAVGLVFLSRAPGHTAVSELEGATRGASDRGCVVGSSEKMAGLSSARRARVFETEVRGHGQCICLRRTFSVAMLAVLVISPRPLARV